MDTPSTPQSRSDLTTTAASAASASKPITPSQIPLSSTPTPTAISSPNPAAKVPLPETPIPNTQSSIEKLKLAAEIPLPETQTPAAAISESKVDDGCSVTSETIEVPEVFSAAPNDPTSHLLSELSSKTPSKLTSSFLDHPIPTPEISPLKLAPTSQSQSHLSNSPTSSISQAGSMVLEEIPSLAKNEKKEKQKRHNVFTQVSSSKLISRKLDWEV
ncbi:hypothetical protein BOTNAR_0201g00060 [Botryotinia narcissicola]|uniref:Uncharacterized protein n=1 Tax=Botryotinia narcissicola TaxID=278944 RepID=A0A4Z1IEE8_9HELO|nr:hypothetical protein BOTNAR_0201g00060 [Botryotinia narcissicola]